MKLSLSCVIIGVEGSAFSVDINADQSVRDLKEVIKDEKKDIKTPARDLRLFLAKKDDGWLPSTNLAALQGSKANIPVSFERVPLTDATWSIQGVLKEKKLPEPQTRHTHVLVVVPDGRKRFRSDLWFAESSQPLKTRRVSEDVSDDEDEDVSDDEDEDEDEDEEDKKDKERTFFEMNAFHLFAHPVTEHGKIVERKAYVVIFAQLLEHVKACFESGQDSNVVVTGNPGTGKSRFYLYCIFQLIRNQEREDIKQLPPYDLVLNYENRFHKYDAASAEFVQLNAEDVDVLMDKPRVLRLVQARSTKLTGWRGVSALFAPPNVEGLKDFEKVDGPMFIMPTWSLEELEEYNELLPEALRLAKGELISRYAAFGGVPRFVFWQDKARIEGKLNRAIASFSAAEIIAYCQRSAAVKGSDYSDCVFQMAPTEDSCRTKFHLDFLSSDIAEKIVVANLLSRPVRWACRLALLRPSSTSEALLSSFSSYTVKSFWPTATTSVAAPDRPFRQTVDPIY